MGGDYRPAMHHQALPTIAEVERNPALNALIPEFRVQTNPPIRKKPAIAKKPAASVVKKPAAAMKDKAAKNVVKKPAAAVARVSDVVTKPRKQVAKKPASSAVRPIAR